MHAAGKPARRSGKRHGDKAHDGQADGGNQKPTMAAVGRAFWSASNGGMMRLPAPKSIENAQCHGNDMVGAQAARSG
ncbi:MAG: hypothetical protein ACLRM9_00965 [Collinsella aerofaciens]